MMTLIRREPAAVAGLVQAVLALLVSFGFGLSPEQVGALAAVSAAVLGLMVRRNVSPVDRTPTDG